MTRLSGFLEIGEASISMLEFFLKNLKTQGSDLIFR